MCFLGNCTSINSPSLSSLRYVNWGRKTAIIIIIIGVVIINTIFTITAIATAMATATVMAIAMPPSEPSSVQNSKLEDKPRLP